MNCRECTASLAGYGVVTLAGEQAQELLQIPSAAPGIVQWVGVTLPPPAKKWDIPPLNGAVKIRREVDGKKVWVDFESHMFPVLDKGKPAWSTRLAGIGISGAYPCVSGVNESNAVKAVCCRIFRLPKHTPVPGIFKAISGFLPLLLPGFVEPVVPWDFQTWVDTMPARRRKALCRAFADYKRRGWSKRMAVFSAFVKTELLPGFEKTSDGFAPLSTLVDRLIQGPHDATHCIAGPFLKPLTSRLKEVWAPNGPIFYASRSLDQIQGWYRASAKRWGVAADFTMYDNSHSAQSWAFMEEIYRGCGSDAVPDFRRVMEAWRMPAGHVAGMGWVVKYVARIMNASGRDDTSLANSLLNGVCTFLSMLAALKRVPVWTLREEDLIEGFGLIRLAVCGDDSLCFLDSIPGDDASGFAKAVSAGLAAFGFDAAGDKLLVTENHDELVFLGHRRYRVRGEWWLGKTAGRALYKLGFQSRPFALDPTAWAVGVAHMELHISCHVPLLSDIARRVLAIREEKGHKVTLPQDPFQYTDKLWRLTSTPAPPYDDDTKRHFCAVYGLGLAELDDCIRRISEIPTLPYLVDHPVLRRVIEHDDL